jgi:hypothetical protein
MSEPTVTNPGKRSSWSGRGQSFVTLSGAGERETRHDILERERLLRIHVEADETERQSREHWNLCRNKGFKFGFDYEWLDQTFEHRGEVYKIVGVKVIKEEALIVCRTHDRFARMGVPFIATKMGAANGQT